jgi:acetyl esterase/lipase
METPLHDFDAAYDNRAAVPDALDLIAAHSAAARAFREVAPPETVAYGDHPRAKLDLFRPESAPRGLFVFVHGGYWRTMDRGDFSHMAAGMRVRGWAVAIVGYPLCPEVRVSDITRHVAAATAAAARLVAGPVLVAGHSAGGHLAARLICEPGLVPGDVAARIVGVLPISGLHDLRPLTRTKMNGDLRLDTTEAVAESPLLRLPREDITVLIRVGADELPELRRQSSALASVWQGLGANVSWAEIEGTHHFDVIDALADPESPMVADLLSVASTRADVDGG